MAARGRGERGQTSAEYIGVLLLVALIVAALAASGLAAGVAAAVFTQVDRIAGGSGAFAEGPPGPPSAGSAPSSADAAERHAAALQQRVDELAELAQSGGELGDLHRYAQGALAVGDLDGAERAIALLQYYDEFIDAGARGGLLEELNAPDAAEFEELVERRDFYLDGGETSRRFFEVDPEPGRGVVAFDFFIPSANSNGFRGDGRPEEGTDVLRSDLELTDSRVMIVIDFETGRAVIVQSETHMDGPWGVGGANEPRPISLNGDRGAFDNQGGIDIDGTNQIDFESDSNGMHVDWDILNSITPLGVSVDGDVDFEEGDDGFLRTDDFSNQDLVDRYPQIQVWQYVPEGRSREIGRNDYQGGHNPVLGALPHCNAPDGPDLPTIGIGDRHVWDMPNIFDGPTFPGPC